MTMETTSYYLLPLIIIIIVPFLYSLMDTISRKIRNLPPSPPLSFPIFGHLHLIKKLPKIFSQLPQKYGPILMLYFGSRPILLVSSPSAVEECLTKNDIVFANRPKFLAGKYLGYDYTTLIWAPYGQHWRNLRKLATLKILSSARIQAFANVRRDEVRSMMQRLTKASDGAVEMKSAFFELTLSIMMRMIVGKRGSSVSGDEASEREEEGRRFREMIKESNLVNPSTMLADYVPMSRWIGGRSKLLRKLESLQARRDGYMQGVVEERRKTLMMSRSCGGGVGGEEEEEEYKSMIDVLLSLQESEPDYYKDDIIKGMIQVMLIGGSETTAITMEWAFSLLLNNPNTLSKAHQEIQNHIGKSNRLINDSDLTHLPYLQAIIDETLRIYPVGNFIGHHEASESCIVGGYNIPRGTILFVNHRAIHYDPKIWEEPNKFKPERFLNVEKENFKFMYLPFSHGRRGCPGERSAKHVLGLTLGSLIQCFEWARVGEELLDMAESSGLNVARVEPLFAKCRPRPEMMKHLLSQNAADPEYFENCN